MPGFLLFDSLSFLLFFSFFDFGLIDPIKSVHVCAYDFFFVYNSDKTILPYHYWLWNPQVKVLLGGVHGFLL